MYNGVILLCGCDFCAWKNGCRCYIFLIENTCINELHKNKDGFYLSTKGVCRGIGLSSVQNITRQYNGIFEMEQKKEKLIVSIMLNIPKNPLSA